MSRRRLPATTAADRTAIIDRRWAAKRAVNIGALLAAAYASDAHLFAQTATALRMLSDFARTTGDDVFSTYVGVLATKYDARSALATEYKAHTQRVGARVKRRKS